MIRLRSLGQCLLEVGDTRLTPAAETLFAAALYLVLEAGRPLARRELIDVIWPNVEDRKANQCLRQTLYKLNAMGAALRSTRTQIVLPRRSVQSDCGVLFEVSERAEMERMADTLPGGFLPAYAPKFSAPYQEWLERQRDFVTSALRRILVTAMNARKARGEWRRAEPLAMRCLAIDPLNEEATLVLAEATAIGGNKVMALAIIDRYLREIGPEAREIRLPATLLRRRIAEVYNGDLFHVRETPHVGRDAEMAELTRAMHAALASRGSSFLIWGEPGIGKTRLATEFIHGASLAPVQVARVGCQSHDARRPLSIFVDLVPRLLELRGSVGCSPDSMKYLKRLISHDPSDTSFTPDSRESELLFSNIRRSIFDLLDAIATEAALIVLIEDIHWLDRMSWEIMRDIPGWVSTRPVVVVLTSRNVEPVSHFSEGEQGAPTLMNVLPLAEGPSRELIRCVTAGTIRESNSEFQEWCVSSAGGNPYFLTELAFHTSWDGEQYQAPATLDKLVSERLNRLNPLATRVLQAAGILGKLSTLERVEGVLGERRIALLDALEELEAFGLVISDGQTVFCKHELLSSAALQRLSALSSALLHRHAAQLLEKDIVESQSTVLLWECARHWQHAGERERALTLLRTCAHHSIEIGLPTEAVTLLEHALTLASDHEESLPIVAMQVTALYLADYWEKLPATIEMLRRLREQGHQPTEVHTEDELLGLEAEWRLGGNIEAIFARIVECTRAHSRREHNVRAGVLALMLADNVCSIGAAQRLHAQLAPYLDGQDVHAVTRTYFNMIYSCSFGDPDASPGYARELIRLARTNGNAAILCRNLRHASIAFEVAGLIAEAEASAIEAFEQAKRLGLDNAATGAIAGLVGMYSRLGQMREGQEWYRRAMDHRGAFSGAINHSNLIGFQVKLAIQNGFFEEADYLIDLANHNLRPGASLRHRAEIAAQRTHLAMRRGQAAPTQEEVQELLAMHLSARSFNWHDYVAAVLFEALLHRQERQTTIALAREYVNDYRRGRSPLLPELAACLATLDVSALPAAPRQTRSHAGGD